jgi:NAD-dependent DNA ligase
MNAETIDKIVKDPHKFANSVTIAELVKTLQRLSEYYYNTGVSLVSDEIYDILRDLLIEKDPTNAFLKQIGAPLTKNKIKLPYFMPSLDKIKPTTDALAKWTTKYKGEYVLSDKLDGVSALLYKDNQNKIKLYTRGDGIEGQDISHLIPFVLNTGIRFDEIPKDGAIRGELIISKDNFQKISKDFKNARNAVAGLVNAKHFSKDVASVTDFIGYAVINPVMTQVNQMKQIEKWNIPVVTYIVKKSLTNDLLSDYLTKRRKEAKYEVDGIVVIDSSKAYPNTLANPEYGFAFKAVLTDQVAEATVVDVLWDVSKHGYLKPRVKIQPINLVGVEITYATAFNAKFVKDNVLGPGAVIKLVRSGDVIPYIMEVIKPSPSGEAKMPTVPYYWTDTKVDIIVKDVHGERKDRILVKQITSFFKILDVKFLSEGIVTKFVENGYKSVVDIIKGRDKLTDIEGVGDKLVTKIFTNIDNAFKTATLYQLMAASNLFGRGFGTRRTKLITDAYPDIMKTDWTTEQMTKNIEKIDGFDTLTASQFAKNFDKFKLFMSKLEKVVDLSHLAKKPAIKKIANRFADMKVVFSGIRDKAIEQLIEAEGGKVTTSVSSNTTLLIYADKETSKYQKAVELKIPTLTLDEFKKKYNII